MSLTKYRSPELFTRSKALIRLEHTEADMIDVTIVGNGKEVTRLLVAAIGTAVIKKMIRANIDEVAEEIEETQQQPIKEIFTPEFTPEDNPRLDDQGVDEGAYAD